MPAKDYSIMVAGLTGAVFIGKKSKRDANVMLDDRRKVEDKEFIDALIYWAVSKMNEGSDEMEIRGKGNVVVSIKVDRKRLEL